MKYTDISGEVIGYLTVIERAGADNTGKNSLWLCKCKCGNTAIISRSSLTRSKKNGFIASCGCRQFESKNATHGLSKTRIYHEWCSMKKRCYSANEKDFRSYEGRGITVCNEWIDDFLSFYDWATSNGYKDGLTIDRINVDEGYSPDNCRWISIGEQQSNKKNTVHIEYQGQDWCLRTLCRQIGFPYKTAHLRYRRMINRGIEVTPEALFKPIDESKISKRFRDKK